MMFVKYTDTWPKSKFNHKQYNFVVKLFIILDLRLNLLIAPDRTLCTEYRHEYSAIMSFIESILLMKNPVSLFVGLNDTSTSK